jgi:hypothetical protein
MMVIGIAGVLLACSFIAVANAAEAGGRESKIDSEIAILAKSKLLHAGYPSTWRTDVRCHPPAKVKVGATFSCSVSETPLHQNRALSEGTLRATVSNVAGAPTEFSIRFQAVPSGLKVGPGPMATYSIQAQPASGSCHYTFVGADPLPDRGCTPGAINPEVTQANIGSTICRSGYTESIRPPKSVTEVEKRASARAYDYSGTFRTAEYDHLIPLELGGDPNASSNLWVEPNDRPDATSTANTKDILEDRLNTLVCSGVVPLGEAQQAIASNWVAAYAKYVGAQVPSSTQPATPTTGAPVQTTSPPPTTTPPRATAPPTPTPPTTSPPTTPPPPPPPASSCTASMSNPTPGDGGDEIANVVSNVPSTAGTVTVRYKTTTHPFPFQTDSSGNAAVTFDIGSPTVGYQVAVDVSIGAASCSTSFTPQ